LILAPDFSYEQRINGAVCGVDEAGRGPLAGPVVAAAVILPQPLPELLAARLNDSKKLSATLRERLFAQLETCAQIGVGSASVVEIDQHNILQATFLAMQRAVQQIPATHALIDGNQKPHLPIPLTCIVGGDGLSLSIAAASIVAKVTRDRIMSALAREYSAYGWEQNAGYGTKRHFAAIEAFGITPYHRRSFAPVAAKIT
jgi:ribonuclease HII